MTITTTCDARELAASTTLPASVDSHEPTTAPDSLLVGTDQSLLDLLTSAMIEQVPDSNLYVTMWHDDVAEDQRKTAKEIRRQELNLRRRGRAARKADHAPVFSVDAATAERIGDGAACAVLGECTWFTDPTDRAQVRDAIRICENACPMKDECLSRALDSKSEWGVWGGVWFSAGQIRKRFYTPRETAQTDVEDADLIATDVVIEESAHLAVVEDVVDVASEEDFDLDGATDEFDEDFDIEEFMSEYAAEMSAETQSDGYSLAS